MGMILDLLEEELNKKIGDYIMAIVGSILGDIAGSQYEFTAGTSTPSARRSRRASCT